MSRLLETYSLLSLENKEKITDIDRITSSVEQAAQIVGADRYKLKVMSFNVYYSKLTEERMGLVAERIRGESTETLQGFGEKSAIIDFTFVNSYFPVTSYKVCEPKIDGEWVSDHNAIVSELILYPTSKSLGAR